MGFFNFKKKDKDTVEEYYEQRKKKEETLETHSINYDNASYNSFEMKIEDVFSITGRGKVVVGKIARGTVSVGETIRIEKKDNKIFEVNVKGIESFRKLIKKAGEGMNVGILLEKNDSFVPEKDDRLFK